jgi:hypothetical protein
MGIARSIPVALIALLCACAQPTTPQVQGPLSIEVQELCTVCVEVLRCEGGERRSVYVMDEKGAWAQIATIWDYFADVFRPKTEDFRKVTSYELASDGATVKSRSSGREARLDVWNRRIELPDSVVDQKSGNWLGADGSAIGLCTVLPRGPDRELAKTLENAP